MPIGLSSHRHAGEKISAQRSAENYRYGYLDKHVCLGLGGNGMGISGGPIAVAVEQVKGALVCMLRKYECLHLFPVPSSMSAAMRKALYPSGAKDDPRDADLLLELLVQHRDRLRHLQPDNEETRRVQNLVEVVSRG